MYPEVCAVPFCYTLYIVLLGQDGQNISINIELAMDIILFKWSFILHFIAIEIFKKNDSQRFQITFGNYI